MPPIPAARSFTTRNGLIGTAAVTASAAPLLIFVPGFEERLAAQAAKWGPRWNKGFATIQPQCERGWEKARIDTRMQKGVKTVEPPLKKAAL